MYTVSQEFLNQIKAPVRRVDARVTIDYTDPTQDQTIEVTASEQANVSYPVQTADFATEPTYKWAALDGTWVLDGTWHLAPAPEDAYLYQMGWWSAQVAGQDGRFSEPYPTLILTHPARPVTTFQVVGDSARGEWPTEFAIRLYGPDGSLLRERVVEGNTQVHWQEELDPPALDVTRQELEIRAWSHPGRHAKILEFFTSLQETYESQDLLKVHLLEESESGSGVGIGGVTTNELTVRLVNHGGRFDVTNSRSSLRELLRPNRRIRAWLGIQADGAGQNVDRTETTQSDWQQGTLSGVMATAAGDLALWRPDFYGPFDADLNLVKKDGTVVAPLSGSVATLRPGEGKFGGAVAVEEGRLEYPQSIWNHATGTFAAWVKTPTDVSTDRVLTLQWANDAAGSDTRFGIRMDTSGRFVVSYGSPNTLTTADSYNDGEWHHVVLTWVDGTADIHLYVDGERVVSASEPISVNNPGGRYGGVIPIGHRGYTYNDQWWNGLIDELLILPYATAEEEIQRWYVQGLPASGARTSPPLDLSPVGTAAGSSISWNATTPEGTSVTVETNLSLDGGATWQGWQVATNGGPVPGITAGMDLSQARLQTRVTLSTTDTTVTPKVHELTIRVNHEEWVPLGTYWSGDWDSQDLEAMVRGRDRLEILRRTHWEPGQLRQDVSLYALAEDVMRSAELPPEWYWIDPALQDIVVPWGWVPPGSHRDALRVIVEAGIARVYCDRDGILRIQGLTTGQHVPLLDITSSDYFPPMRSPSSSVSVANRVVVTTQPLVPAASLEEVYRATVDVPPGATITIRAEYRKRPVIDATASLESPPAGVSIVEDTYGAASAEVTIRNTGASAASVTLVITGRPLSVEGGEQVVEEDDLSIRELGLIVHEVPSNPLVQTREHARAISLAILARSAKQRRDIELEWRGNPALEAGDCVRIVGIPAEIVRQELAWAGALSTRITARRLS